MKCPLCHNSDFKPWAPETSPAVYLKCAICHFVWLIPEQRPTAARQAERYREHHNLADDPPYQKYLGRLVDRVKPHLTPGQRGIDYGSGPVEGMRALMEPQGWLVASYDPDFFPGLGAFKEPVQFILCNEAAEHFFEPAEDFRRFAQLLPQGGILGLRTECLPEESAFAKWWYRKDDTHICFYSTQTFQWLAARDGWRILEASPPFWVMQKL